MPRDPDISRLRTPDGDWVGPEELLEILADEGYSAGQRGQFLKSVLTELASADAAEAEGARRRALMAEIRTILEDEHDKWDRSSDPDKRS